MGPLSKLATILTTGLCLFRLVVSHLGKELQCRKFELYMLPNFRALISEPELLNLQTDEKFEFIVNDWLAVDKGDGQVSRDSNRCQSET